MARRITWFLTILFYLAFALWYTNRGGALTDAEIAGYLQAFKALGHTQAQLQRVELFMRQDTGRQFIMVNSLDLNETPPPVPGATEAAGPQALLGHYMEYMYPALLKRASHPIYLGPAVGDALDLAGIEGAETWDFTGLMRYRSRRDLMAITSDPRFQERHPYKVAALTKTIAYPVENALYLSDPRLLLALLLYALLLTLEVTVFRKRAGTADSR